MPDGARMAPDPTCRFRGIANLVPAGSAGNSSAMSREGKTASCSRISFKMERTPEVEIALRGDRQSPFRAARCRARARHRTRVVSRQPLQGSAVDGGDGFGYRQPDFLILILEGFEQRRQ